MNSILDTLNDEQRAAATYEGPADHLLLLAGAGTGKTRTIIARTLYLLKKNVDPRRILLMTFTRRAASEMKQRLEAEVGHQAFYLNAGTFHRFCLNQMRKRPGIFGIKDRTLFDRDDQMDLMKLSKANILRDLGIKKEVVKDFLKPSMLVNLYSYSRNTLAPIHEYLDKYTNFETNQKNLILAIYDYYEKRKVENGYLDFDDILYLFVEKLETNYKLQDYIKDMYDHILVDEMQDTNPVQWKILEKLHNPAKLFCVGDDAQSIYAFRGADFKNVHSFTKRVSNSAVLKLVENYRSTQPILDMSNWLLERSTLDYDKELMAHRGDGVKPCMKTFEGPYGEADFVIHDIKKRIKKGLSYKQFMVMVRSAFAARTLEGQLLAEKIPYRFIGGLSLLQMAHIKDLLACAKALTRCSDEIAWLRFLQLFPKIGEVSASRFYTQLQDFGDIKDHEDDLYKIFGKRPDICQVIEAVINCETPKAFLAKAAKALDPILDANYSDWKKRKKDSDTLVEVAERFQTMRQFLEDYTLDPDYNEKFNNSDEDKLTIITIHSAKGTECDICYIIQAKPGMFPHSKSDMDMNSIEEERRILYVAMTRARNELIITRTFDDHYYNQSFSEYFLEFVPGRLYNNNVVEYVPEENDDNQYEQDVPF